MRYKVTFEFMVADAEVSDGKWHSDFLDNNGEGMTFEDAERTACELRAQSVTYTRNVDVVEMEA